MDAERRGLGGAPGDLVMVVPTYNEVGNIHALVQRLDDARRVAAFDVLVVDDSSPDGTAAGVRELQATRPWLHLLVRAQRSGLGSAYRHGFRWALAASYGFVGEMDADLSHDPGDVPALWAAVRDGGVDLALGSRYVRGGRTEGWPYRRKVLSRGANVYARLLLRLRTRDVTSGFRVYRRAAVEHLLAHSGQCEGYGFQVEGVHALARAGLRITELPITFREREVGCSKMSAATAIEAARRCLQMAFSKAHAGPSAPALSPGPLTGEPAPPPVRHHA